MLFYRADGKELFYVGGDNKIWAVEIKRNQLLEPGTPKPLFELHSRFWRPDEYDYDVSADGQRFLVNSIVESGESPSVYLIVNWPALLK